MKKKPFYLRSCLVTGYKDINTLSFSKEKKDKNALLLMINNGVKQAPFIVGLHLAYATVAILGIKDKGIPLL